MAAPRIAGVLFVVAIVSPFARAQAPGDAAGERARREAVAKGLDSLAGVWRQETADNNRKEGVAVASLSGIAFLQSGSTPDAGPYREQVDACLDFVLASARDDGLLLAGNVAQAPMYGHGFGMLFLAEAYARSKDEAARKRILPVLEKAVALSEKAQNKEGGWRYQPKPFDADVSVTVGQLNGLLAAKAAGVRVPDEVLKKAGDYVASCQNDDGGFSYMAHGGGGGNSGLPRTAAALAALQHAGAATPAQRDKAVAFVAKFADPGQDDRSGHVFYSHYYVAQAMLAAGGEHRTKTAAAFRDALVKRQEADGAWSGDFSKTYATAMALIALQMPDRWLTVLGSRE
jgi:hypothetical protein